jgi:hypothetical protein
MKAQATVRSINPVRAASPITIDIQFDGNRPKVSPAQQTVHVQYQDTVTWNTAALPADGTVSISFDPFDTVFKEKQGTSGQGLTLGSFTVDADPGLSSKTYHYSLFFQPSGGAKYRLDPVIIVDPTGGDDQQPG